MLKPFILQTKNIFNHNRENNFFSFVRLLQTQGALRPLHCLLIYVFYIIIMFYYFHHALMFIWKTLSNPSPPEKANVSPSFPKSTVFTSLDRSVMQQNALFQFSLSNNFTSFVFDPPAKIKVPSALENYPEYKNTGSKVVLREPSQSMSLTNL